MKEFREVFKKDIKGIFSSRFAILVIVGLVIIPATYAWFNIYASWNPYDNTSGLKVAVACEDSGTHFLGTDINVGDEVIDELKSDSSLDWIFVDSADEVIDGVTSSEYYAGIVIPSDYSSNFVSITTPNVTNPSIEYYVNQKINPISPIITSEGMSELQSIINSTFIQMSSDSILNILSGIKGNDSLLDSVTNNTSDNLDLVINSIDAFKNGSLSMDSLVKSINSTLPYLESSLDSLNGSLSQMDNAVMNLSSANSSLVNLLSSSISSVPTEFSSINDSINSAFSLLNTSGADVGGLLMQSKSIISSTISQNSTLKSTLLVLENQFPDLKFEIDMLVSGIDNTNAVLSVLNSDIDVALSQLQDTSTISADLQGKIISDVSSISSGLVNNLNYFNSSVSPNLSSSLNSVSSSISAATNSISSGSSALPYVTQALSYASDSAVYAANGLDSLQKVLIDIKSSISSLQSDVSTLNNFDLISSFDSLLNNNPSTVADFFASPVTINTNNIYPVDSFGAAMSPFYTSLAIWVGGLFLVAILKTDLSENDRFKKYNTRKLFFSRLSLFVILCLLQSLIVSLGDIFILHCYCLHPFAFVLVCLYTSIVFCSIMFCLTDVFGNIGKAIAVLIMVFQVAGSGGTYPIELTQPIFLTLQKFMPFTYSVGAMRETIGGIYSPNFTKDMIVLTIYMIVAFLIAYLCKPRFNDLKHRLENKMLKFGIG